MQVPIRLQQALDEFNTNFPRPGIPPLTFSLAYDLKNHWPKHYPFKRQQGVYCFVDSAGALLYIGKTSCSNDFGYRLSGHFEYALDRTARAKNAQYQAAQYIYVISLPSGHGFEAPAIEEWLIARLRPSVNSMGNNASRQKTV